jgi:ABC-type nitrate/sulfonate/bicarbonate transport system permease component
MNPRDAWARQSAAFVLLLVVWEAAGRAGRLNPIYAPSPSQIAAALVELFRSGRIWTHLEAPSPRRSSALPSESLPASCWAFSARSFR